MKPFKGYVTLELSDGQKKTQKIEGHNMVTKALEYFYKQGGMTNPSAFNANVIRTEALKYLLGGVMCLDTALTENNEIIRVPAGVGMTANGARDVVNTDNPPELGSYNTLESGWQNDGSFKMVWDWNTSQGNGTIACVCLSSAFGGMRGIGNKSNTYKANSYAMSSVNSFNQHSGVSGTSIGMYNNILTALDLNVSSTVAVSSQWTFRRYSYPNSQIDIRDAQALRLLSETTIQAPIQLNGWYHSYGLIRAFQQGKYGYLICASARTSGSYYTRFFRFNDEAPVYIFKFDLETGAYVSNVALSPTTTGLSAQELGEGVYPTLIATDRWYQWSKYIFDATNLTNVTELSDFFEDTTMCPVNSDITEGQYGRTDLANGIIRRVNNNDNYEAVGFNGLLGHNGSYIFRDPRYIATIFNLDSPVTKDASKTMKVTYVLRFS